MAEYILLRGEKPLHRQLADQVQKQITDGRLASGAQLPTVRMMASLAGVSRVTVLQAYELLRIRGLADARVGAGTYVRVPEGVGSGSSRLKKFSPCSIVTDYNQTASAGDIVTLATAYADETLFQEDDFVVGAIPRRTGDNYVDHLYGDPNLIAALAGHYKSLGINVPQDEMLVMGGAVASNATLAGLLGRDGGKFIIQEPLFPYAVSYLESFGCTPLRVPKVDGDLDTARLEECLKSGEVRLMFLEMAYDSATGLSASLPNKREVLYLAEKYQVPIAEDISGIWWRHTDKQRPCSLWQLSSGLDVDVVAYDCFTKLISASVSLSTMFVSGKLRERLSIHAIGQGSRPPKILQTALTDFITTRKLTGLMSRAAPKYTARRDAVLNTLGKSMPRAASWTVPESGLSLWLSLPSLINDRELYSDAIKAGVAVAPGSTFMTQQQTSSIRISFSSATSGEIEQAIIILSDIVKNLLKATA